MKATLSISIEHAFDTQLTLWVYKISMFATWITAHVGA